MQRRLAWHGYNQLCQLQKDPIQQEAMTTWIEYLNYEYFWLDWFTKAAQRLKPSRDKATQKLVDSPILKPHETEKFLRTLKSLRQFQADQDHAWKAVESATLKAKQIYILSQSDSQQMSIPQQIHTLLLQVAKRRYLAAKFMLASAKKRADLIFEFIRETNGYDSKIQNASRHRLLLSLVLDQVPLLKIEMAQSKATVTSTNEIENKKRKFDFGDNSLGKRDLKKQKSGHRNVLRFCDGIATEVKGDEGKQQQHMDSDEGSAPCNIRLRSKAKENFQKQCGCLLALSQHIFHGSCNRRSARIAARQISVETTFPPKP